MSRPKEMSFADFVGFVEGLGVKIDGQRFDVGPFEVEINGKELRRVGLPDWAKTLGFSAEELGDLTASKVKARHRELMREHHPDRGGSTKKATEINLAVQAALETLTRA